MKRNRWLSLIFVAVLIAAQAGCHYAALDPSGQFAYVMDNNCKLLVYQIDPATGVPNKILWNYAPGSAVQPYSQAQISDQIPIVDPSGRFLYLELKLTTGATILEYQIDQSTHGLSLLPTALNWTTNVGINGLAMDPLGRFLFVSGGGGLASYSIDPRSGQLTQNGSSWFSTGGTTESPVVDPKGRFVYALNSAAFGPNPGVVSLSINPDGTLQQAAGPFFPAGASGPESMAIDQTGSFMVITDNGADPGNIYTARINRQTGALTLVGTPVAAGHKPFDPAFDPSNQYLYVSSNDQTVLTYAFDISTGALTPGTPTSPLAGGLQQLLVNGVMK